MPSLRTCALIGLSLASLFHAVAAVDAPGSLLSLDEAQRVLPACALSCFETAIVQSKCDPTDLSCICTSSALNSVATACVKAECTIKESLTTKNITSYMCGVTPKSDSSLIPIYATFIGLAVIAVILRLFARVLTKAYFWWDDLSNLFGFFGAAVFTGVNIWAIILGQSKDVWFVPFDDVTMVMRLFFAEMLLYTATRFFVRGSIILFYLRVFPAKSGNKLGRVIQWTLVFNVVYNLSFFFAVLFQCQPIGLFWTQWQGHDHGHCGNANILAWVAAATGIAYDLWLLALPFPALMALNLHWKKKIMGGMMFFVGVAVMIISLVRLKTINQFTRTVNPTKDIVQLCLWSAIELDVGVICPCLPSFRLLLRRMLPHVLSTSGRYEMDHVSGRTGTYGRDSKGATSAMRSGTRRSIGGTFGYPPPRSPPDHHHGGGIYGAAMGSTDVAVEHGGNGSGKLVAGHIVVGHEVHVVTTKYVSDGSSAEEHADGRSMASVTGLMTDDEEMGGKLRGGILR